MIDPARLAEIRDDIRTDAGQPAYRSYNGLWLSLVKLANLLPGAGPEPEQILSLARRLSRGEAAAVLADPGLEQLLQLDPPLETLLSDPRERLEQSAAQDLGRIRSHRSRDPKAALLALIGILRRIRNKREHGFKSPRGPRDREILEAGVAVLRRLCNTLADRLASDTNEFMGLEHDA